MNDSFALIWPYVRALGPYFDDPEVSEIMVNADGSIYIERDGVLWFQGTARVPERQRQAAVRNIARLLGNDISEEMPMLEARLPDGSRVSATMPPASVGGTVLNIRKFRQAVFTAAELVRREMLTEGQLAVIRAAIDAGQTILISGGTGTGKTTLLSALTEFLPDERIVVIEDTAELTIKAQHVVRLEARRAQPDIPEVTVRQLLRQSLRMRPDRIILGEVRGVEAFDLLQAMNTGHSGTISTIHANSARLAVERFRTLIATADSGMPDYAIARNIPEVVDMLVHITRKGGHRSVTEVLSLGRYDAGLDSYQFLEVTDESRQGASAR